MTDREAESVLLKYQKKLKALPKTFQPYERSTTFNPADRWKGLNKSACDEYIKKKLAQYESQYKKKLAVATETCLLDLKKNGRIRDNKVEEKLKDMMCYVCKTIDHDHEFCPKLKAASEIPENASHIRTILLIVEQIKKEKAKLA